MNLKYVILLTYFLFYFSILSKAQHNLFEINVTNIKGKLLVQDIQINNSNKSYNFIIDTGSSFCSISKDVAQEFNINVTKNDVFFDGLNEYRVDYSYFHIKIKGYDFGNIRCDIIDIPNILPFCKHIDGIIGGNLLKDFVWKITNNKITFSKKIKNFDIKKYTKHKLDLLKNVPYLKKLKIKNNIQSDILFDLGDNTLFSVGKETQKYIRKTCKTIGYGSMFTTICGDIPNDTISRFRLESPLIIGGVPLYNIIGESNFDMFGGTIGSLILIYCDIIIDYNKKRFYLYQKKPFDDDLFKTFGFKYKINTKYAEIIFLWNTSQVNKQGLSLGDKILSINNINIENLLKTMPICELYKIIDFELEKNIISLKVKSANNNIKECVLHKENLFK